MPPAARQTDKALHDAPHCHAPIHPPAPTPTPLAHPPVPIQFTAPAFPNVKIGGAPAIVQGTMTAPCMMPSCVPGAPGIVAKGSMKVKIMGMPAARIGDMVQFPSCVAPIPSPTGKIVGPGAPTVQVGG